MQQALGPDFHAVADILADYKTARTHGVVKPSTATPPSENFSPLVPQKVNFLLVKDFLQSSTLLQHVPTRRAPFSILTKSFIFLPLLLLQHVPIRQAPFSMLTKSLIFLPLCLQQDSLYTQQGLQILLVPGSHMHLM
jgi:hypothetical protein